MSINNLNSRILRDYTLGTDKNDFNESKKFFITEMYILLYKGISVDDIVHKRLALTLLQQQ